jgi:hypothetical protein
MMDPFALLARLRKFAEPSEVNAPLELVRAWTVFQARGIVNTRAIQHNLDWIWPYWVERQYDPHDVSFLPRAYSVTHINLTHRNWTAVSLPDGDLYSLVDPRGLVTPLPDGWSLDFWLRTKDGELLPSRAKEAEQCLDTGSRRGVVTRVASSDLSLASHVFMRRAAKERPELVIELNAETGKAGDLLVNVRPYNPEGIQFVDRVDAQENGTGWRINDETEITFSDAAEKMVTGSYERGDVYNLLDDEDGEVSVKCDVGMATASAQFPLTVGSSKKLRVCVELPEPPDELRLENEDGSPDGRIADWNDLHEIGPGLNVPDPLFERLFDASMHTLLAFSARDVYPGPYTYRRFWFRDACIMLRSLVAMNHDERCSYMLEKRFGRRQTRRGFFESQEGEWDSNGQVLWLAGEYERSTGHAVTSECIEMLRKGADWIGRKRRKHLHDPAVKGLLPAGFSAEHFGPNNFYYWDNFWGASGLLEFAEMLERSGDKDGAAGYREEGEAFLQDVLRSIHRTETYRRTGAIPAAPNRRLDAGAIGVLAAGYPLRLVGADDAALLATVDFLMENCLFEEAFFQDMMHSGMNAYLTLHIAQVLLRAGDDRYAALVRRVAELATPTGQWPEAIHPITKGGCMGDGQHGWAAAEWVMMIRNMFVREEENELIIGSGLFPEWLAAEESLAFGPTKTAFGNVRVHIEPVAAGRRVTIDAQWRRRPQVRICLPGFRACEVGEKDEPVVTERVRR